MVRTHASRVVDLITPVALSRLLRLKLIQLVLLTIDLRLLRRHPSLQVFVLLLPRLHLIADQRAAEEPDRSPDASAGAGVAGGAADDRAQAGSETVPIAAPFSLVVSGSEQPSKQRRQEQRRNMRDWFCHFQLLELISARNSAFHPITA